MTEGELVAKFRDCLAYTARPVPAGNVDRIIDLVSGLEKVKDVGRILKLLTGA